MTPPIPPTPQRKPPPSSSEDSVAASSAAPADLGYTIPSTGLAERLAEVRGRIAAACAKASRDPSEVTLVAVTKYAAPEQIRELISLGVADLGESRVQQLVQRAGQINEFHARALARAQPGTTLLPARIRWHMIGHLQRNKVKPLLTVAACVHTIDSLRLAEELDLQTSKLPPLPGGGGGGGGRKLPVMLQVNASEEPQKYGVAVGAAVHLGEQIASMPNLQLVGLMTMAAHDATEAQTRATFARTREIFEEMRWLKIGGDKLRHLSMGMSNDFEAAILEGATLVRIGSSLFGPPPASEADEKEDE